LQIADIPNLILRLPLTNAAPVKRDALPTIPRKTLAMVPDVGTKDAVDGVSAEICIHTAYVVLPAGPPSLHQEPDARFSRPVSRKPAEAVVMMRARTAVMRVR
jgi:hypothetical protein